MKVSINLVTWNGAQYIKDCLAAVFAQTYEDIEILIIDNNSSDETVALINEQYPHLRVVKNRENLGFAKAHNQAIHWSKSEYVLILNQDTILDPDYVKKLVDFMNKNSQCGSAGGKIYSMREGQKTKYIDTIGLKIFKNYRVIDIAQGQLDEGQFDKNKEVFGVSGAIPMYRRQALESIKTGTQYFDEDFFSYKEDVDLAHRLQYAGWQSFFVTSAQAYHYRSVSGAVKKNKVQLAGLHRKRSKFVNYFSLRNHLFFVIKNLPKKSFKFVWPIFWYEFFKFIYTLFVEPANLKVYSEVFKKRKIFSNKRKQILENRKIKTEQIKKWFKVEMI